MQENLLTDLIGIPAVIGALTKFKRQGFLDEKQVNELVNVYSSHRDKGDITKDEFYKEIFYRTWDVKLSTEIIDEIQKRLEPLTIRKGGEDFTTVTPAFGG